MDFHSLLSAAQQNVSQRNNNDKFYSTKFAPPKKNPKEKKLSDNIKKFLEKQKQEEEEKQRAARQKKLELLARRDPKEQRKIDKTLKVIKSSKKYYTGDKTIDENTEITLQNPYAMPDDDDYGYTSKTSEALHLRLMEKYNKMPEDKKFSSSSQNGKTSKATSATEDSDDFHFKNGQRQRLSKIKGDNKEQSKKASSTSTSVSSEGKKSAAAAVPDKPKPKLKPPPPALNFEELLKLAAQKQHEDIVIDVPTTKKEPERLLTLKEKKEAEELEAARKAKLMRSKEMNRIPKIGASATAKSNDTLSSSKHDRNNNDKDKRSSLPSSISPPKTNIENGKKKLQKSYNDTNTSLNRPQQKSTVNGSIDRRKSDKPLDSRQKTTFTASNSTSSSKSHQEEKGSSNRLQSQKTNLPTKSISVSATNGHNNNNGAKLREALSKSTPSSSSSSSKAVPVKSRDFPPKDLMRAREFPPKDLMRAREFPPKDLKRPREFPPRDMMRRPKEPLMKKRRIVDEDEESEYDSELDDFIDDGEEDFDYSNEIEKIFGYKKSRYQDEDFDDREMESDYRTVMREEFISKKLGLLEDLEDMRKEAEEKKRKEMMKKKRR